MPGYDDEKAHGGNVWAAYNKWGVPPEQVCDFSANINPLGPSPRALKALAASIGLICHYPEPCGESLKRSLAAYLGTELDHVVLGNGGSELIYLAARMFYRGRILLLAPCFSEYGEGLVDPRICPFPLLEKDEYRLPVKPFIEVIESGDLIFIGNPNNPTGRLVEREALHEIEEQARRKNATLVVDEAFLDFTDDPSCSMRDRVGVNKNLLVVSSLTKFFAIPGLRLGYGLAHPETAARMERLLPTWRINIMASAAARASLEDQLYMRETIALITRERDFLTAGLSKIGLEVIPGAANFLLIKSPEKKGLETARLQELLGPRGILVRRCDNFLNLSPYHFRVAVKSRSDNLKLLQALKEAFS